MGAMLLGITLGWVMMPAIWGSAKRKAARPAPPRETKDARKKREREERQVQRRRSDLAKFLADPRFLK